MIEIALRFDDPSATSDHALERGIFAVLRELQIPATVAVVPFGTREGQLVPLDRDNASHLVEAHAAGIIEVAQHGHAHQPLATTESGAHSEFSRVPIEAQAQIIDAGRRVLESVFQEPITGFVPPWNTYDAGTTDLLAEMGYFYLSAGFAAPPGAGIRLIPRTSQMTRLRQACAEAGKRYPLSATIVPVMHHYDFQEARDDPGKLSLQDFRRELERLRNQGDVRFTTLRRIADRLSIPAGNKILARHQRKGRLHWRLQRHLPEHMLFTRPLWLYLR